jgi:hypothetical protein
MRQHYLLQNAPFEEAANASTSILVTVELIYDASLTLVFRKEHYRTTSVTVKGEE